MEISFERQMRWLKEKYEASDLFEEKKVIQAILDGYKRDHKEAVNASWDKYPDRMGK